MMPAPSVLVNIVTSIFGNGVIIRLRRLSSDGFLRTIPVAALERPGTVLPLLLAVYEAASANSPIAACGGLDTIQGFPTGRMSMSKTWRKITWAIIYQALSAHRINT